MVVLFVLVVVLVVMVVTVVVVLYHCLGIYAVTINLGCFAPVMKTLLFSWMHVCMLVAITDSC